MIRLGGLILQHFLSSANESNVYVVACADTRSALLVDAGSFEPEMRAFLQDTQLRIEQVFITHNHYDHTDGLRDIETAFNPVLLGHQQFPGSKARRLAHGDVIRVGNLEARVLDTTGHTPDSFSLYFPGLVFTGDALFAGSVGGTSSPAAASRQLTNIRNQLLTLPGDTEVHPGHGPATIIAMEKQYNPFLS